MNKLPTPTLNAFRRFRRKYGRHGIILGVSFPRVAAYGYDAVRLSQKLGLTLRAAPMQTDSGIITVPSVIFDCTKFVDNPSGKLSVFIQAFRRYVKYGMGIEYVAVLEGKSDTFSNN